MPNAQKASEKPIRKAPTAAATAEADALEQAAAYASIFAPQELPLPNGGSIMIPPHPDYNMLDDDKMEAWDELKHKVNTKYDREPDVYFPEQTLDDGTVIPADTKKGALIQPFAIDGELVKPPHSQQIVRLALGEDGWAQLKAGGGNASDVWKLWGEWSLRLAARQKADPFRAGSTGNLAAVP